MDQTVKGCAAGTTSNYESNHMNLTINGVTYTTQPDNDRCTGCVADSDATLCVQFMLSQPSCGEHPIIWVKAR